MNVDVIEETVRDNPQVPAFRAAVPWSLGIVGRHDEAGRALDGARRNGFETPYDVTWLTANVLWAEAAIRVGDEASAEILYTRLAPWSALNANPTIASLGAVAHYLGGLAATRGDFSVAERHYLQALELHRAWCAPFYVANTEVALSAMLIRRADPDDRRRAEVLADTAGGVARAHQYFGVEREAAEVLRSLRLRGA